MLKKIPSEQEKTKSKISKLQMLQVLLIEDSEDDALLLIRHLRKGGYNSNYKRVATAAAMKKALQEKQWDVILCDYTMPNFSAPSAIALLKKMKIDIPIIIVSGTIGEETAVECMRLGAYDYIMKSNLSRLCPTINRELKEAKVRKKQKYTEEKLHREEQLFRTLAEQSSDIIVLVNSEGKVVYENPAVEILLGLKPEERIEHNVFERVHPDDLKDIKDLFITLFNNKNLTINRKREVRLRHRDGNWRTFEIAASNLLSNDAIETVVVNLHDITERKQVEEELRFRDVLLATQQEVSIDGIFVVDENARILLLNRRFIEMWGLPAKLVEDRVDEPVLQFVTAQMADPQSFLQRVQYLYEHRQETSQDELVLADGRFFDRYSAPMIGSDKRYFGRIWYFRDITERKRAEKELQESERKYKLIAEKMTDVVWMSDMDINVTYVTPSIQNVLGFTQEETKHQTLEEKLTPDSLAYGLEILARELAIDKESAADPNRTVNIVLEYYHKDGSTRWMETIISGLRDDQGVLTGLHGVARDITLRKRVEDELRASEEKFIKAFRYNPSAMSISTVSEGRYIDLNHAYLNTFGYQREEIIGRTSSEINLWVDLADRDAMIQGLTEMGKVNNIELRTRDKHGNIHWLLTSASLIKIGGKSYLLTQSIDVTDRKRAEEALKAVNKQLQDIIEFLPDATLIVDKSHKLIAWNHAIEEMTGIPKAAMIGQDHHQASIPFYGEVRPFLMDLVGMDDEELAAKYSNVRRVGSAVHAEVFTPALYHNKGAYVFAVASPLLDDVGNIVGLIESIRDITESKQAELQRESALESLRKSEELYTRLVNSIPDVIVRTDLEGNILFANDKALQIGGYSWEEIEGHNLLTFVATEDQETAIKDLQRVRKGSRLGPVEYNLLTKDRRKIPFDVSGDVLRNEEGNPFGFVCVCRDISERKRTEKIMREQDELLRDINRNLPGVIYQFYAKDSGEYGISYISEQIDEFSKMIVGDRTPDLGTFFQTFVSRVYEEDREKLATSIKEAVDTISPWSFEGRVSVSSGGVIWFQGLSVPKRLDDRVVFNGILLNINERKLAEEKSRQSEEKFRNIFMANPNSIGIARLSDGLLLDANQRFEDVLGWKREEVIGIRSVDWPHSFWVDPLERNFMVAELKSGRDVQFREFNFRRSDGSVRNGIYSARSINIDNEECLIFILQDITERKLAEEKFRKIFMTSPECIAITRMGDGKLMDVNTGFESMLGSKREEVIGKKVTDPPLNFWVNLSERDFMVAELKSGKDIVQGELKFRRHDGSERFGVYATRTINIDNEECLIFILQDITERREAEEKFRKIFMTSPGAIAITRLSDGTVIDVNKGFEDIVGWTRDFAIGKSSIDPSFDFWVDLSARERMVEDLKASKNVLHRDFEFRKNDGSIRQGIYSARSINIDGEACLIFILQDVTEQKRMEKELVESHKMNVMSQIASGVAHEVRNPLHAIQAISEAMAVDVDEKSDYKKYLTHIKAQVKRLSHLMNDLLELSKPIQSSQFSKTLLMEITAVALRNWLEAYPQLSQQIKVVNKSRPDDFVLVDMNKIQQVIINIMENAIQHSPKDKGILLELDKDSENYFIIKIIDRGTGMKVEDQSRIFEPFYTTRKSGTGLGLSICKHIIESHGGTIALVNNENAPGCTAWFTLPAYSDKERK